MKCSTPGVGGAGGRRAVVADHRRQRRRRRCHRRARPEPLLLCEGHRVHEGVIVDLDVGPRVAFSEQQIAGFVNVRVFVDPFSHQRDEVPVAHENGQPRILPELVPKHRGGDLTFSQRRLIAHVVRRQRMVSIPKQLAVVGQGPFDLLLSLSWLVRR